MREKILALLQTKFEGADAKTLGRIADKLAETTTDGANIQTAVDGVGIMQVMESYGDARVTSAQRTAVKNYEEKYGLKDGKPVQQPKPAEPTKPAEPAKPVEEPDYVKALKEQMAAMQSRLDAADKASITTARKAKLNALLKDAPQDLKNMYQSSFDNMQFNDDAAFDTWLESSKSTIESMTASLKAKGAVTTPPRGGGAPNGQPNPLVVARAERAAKAKPSAIIGASTKE